LGQIHNKQDFAEESSLKFSRVGLAADRTGRKERKLFGFGCFCSYSFKMSSQTADGVTVPIKLVVIGDGAVGKVRKNLC
jgi:hypothetical protein